MEFASTSGRVRFPVAAAALLLMAVLLSACGGNNKGTQAVKPCAPVPDGTAVCINGEPIVWQAEVKTLPHMHEQGGFYAPALQLADRLGIADKVQIDKQALTVKVNGTAVRSLVPNARNIHVHDDLVYAPIKEFAEAAGFDVEVNVDQRTVNIIKPTE